MKQLIRQFRAALFATLVFTIVCCGIYPVIIYAIAQLAFRDRANGSLIMDKDGIIRGSQLLGQPFADVQYFHSRPSAAGAGCDPINACGSNLGPTSRKLHTAVAERIDAYHRANGLKLTNAVPADAVTASGSGLDPHISPESAGLQVTRVATARGVDRGTIAAMVEEVLEPPQLGCMGAPRVNVLRLNIALDEAYGMK